MAAPDQSQAGQLLPRGWEQINRRELLIASGVAGAVVYVERDTLFGAATKPGDKKSGKPKTPQFTVSVRRRDDFLSLRFTFVNLALKKNTNPPKLVRAKATQTAYVIVDFGPQHIGEQAYQLTAKASTTEKPDKPGNSRARMAYATRLAFVVPKALKEIPYDLEHLLDWTALTPNLVPAATATKKPTSGRAIAASALRAPGSKETAIEVPFRLALSPGKTGEWAHELAPVDPGGSGWVEVWHTRLGRQVPVDLFTQTQAAAGKPVPAQLNAAPGDSQQTEQLGPTVRVEGAPVRGVWAYDSDFKKTGKPPKKDTKPFNPFRASLDSRDRTQIVRMSGDVKSKGRADIPAERLWLSSLGAYLEAHGVWEPDGINLNLLEWRHVTTMGRDHYVRVVEKGHYCPTGHQAVRIDVSERRFEKVGTSKVVAVMRKRTFTVCRRPFKSYRTGDSFGILNDSRDLPFRSIRVKTLVSPDLDSPEDFADVNGAFVPMVDNKPYHFHMVGTDWAGRPRDFTVPVVWVATQTGFHEGGEAAVVRDTYNALPADHELRVGIFTGQSVAFADSVDQGDTDVEVKTISFGARPGPNASDQTYADNDQPRFYPTLAEAAVRFGAAEQASGGKPLDKAPVVQYDSVYVDKAFGNADNPGKVFLKVKPDTVPKLDFGSGSSGGVLTPNVAIGGLSRSLGPVGGNPDVVRGGAFTPAEFFKGVEAKILGGVDLLSLIVGQPLSGDAVSDKAMKLTYRTTDEALETRLLWKPDIDPAHPIVKHGDNGGFKFEIDAKVRTDLQDPAKSTFEVLGDLRAFKVHLIGDDVAEFIRLHFNSLTFTAKTGQDADIDVDLQKVEFVGVLEFVDKLREFMSFAQEGGPAIDVTPTGISADLSVPIPDLQVGVFGISNIALIAGFNLPFGGDPARFRFGFSTREDMFALQVAVFGGGGFFGIAIGTDGVEQIEAALEFGAMCAVNLGVASGSVHLLAGIYFSYGTDDKHPEPTCILTGYIRMGGELSVMAIVTLSLEFYMGLTYQSSPEKVYGQATLTVEVSVLCFSGTVEITAERQFGGKDGDPTFEQQIPPTLPDGSHPWDDYCDAFVAV